MRLLLLSDVHGATELLPRLVAAVPRADLVILGGDLTSFGDATDADAVLGPLRAAYGTVRGVPGNTDGPGVLAALERAGASLHGRGERIGDVAFWGAGGSTPTPLRGAFELPEAQLLALLEAGAAAAPPARVRVAVTHVPPRGSTTDRILVGAHVGSSALREHLQRERPTLALVGHVHEAHGIDRVGETLVVNAGAFAAGRYAIIDVQGDQVTATLHRLDLPAALRIGIGARLVTGKVAGYLRHWHHTRRAR
jgi:hypothetical protein